MTDIAFHFGAPDKLSYVCRLLRKASTSGATVLVFASDAMVGKLDAGLWAMSATDFVPHCAGAPNSAVYSRSAVVLASDMVQTLPVRDVLINLTDSVPSQFVDYARLIEVVSTDDADRHSARIRWKHYAERGYPITRHDLGLRGGNE